ncbi:hypothetical protein [Chamaesiphon sp.]|uniref:hypothetical protein n=1 Tax=Chamaesiphon sp. TaxID=2814140 RepID=UPI00359305E2
MQREANPIVIKSKLRAAFREKLHLIILLGLLFIFSLSIPGISYLVMIVIFVFISLPFIVQTLSNKNRVKRSPIAIKFILSLIVLMGFLVTYFMTIYGYNFVDETTAVRGVILAALSYIVGYSIHFEEIPSKTLNYIYVFLALIGGGIIFVYLSVNSSSLGEILERSAPNFWKPGEDPINGTVLDLYSMLGTGIIPIVFYGKNQQFKSQQYKLVTIISLAIGIISIHMSVLLQGRKAILSLVLVLLMTTLFKLKNVEEKNTRNLYFSIIVFISLLLAIASDTIMSFAVANFEVFNRLQNEGLESGRYQAWFDIFDAMPRHFVGGRAFSISASYAHNIWLDVFYDGGLLPMALLLIFHILHIQPFLKVLSSKLPEPIIILTICVIVPVLMGFQGEPVLQASSFYFSTSCCFLGSIVRLSQVADKYNIDIPSDPL